MSGSPATVVGTGRSTGSKGGPAQWNTPIWELDLDKGLRILRLTIDTHLVPSHHLLR